LPTAPADRYLVTCTHCATSATLRSIAGDEIPQFVDAHCHPGCGSVVVTIRLVRRLNRVA
jgi:hypothetical protein